MAVLKIVLDKRQVFEKDKYHLTVRVCEKRKVLYLRVGALLTVREYDQIFSKKTYNQNIEEARNRFEKCLVRAKKILPLVYPYCPKKFRELYFNTKFDPDNIITDDKLIIGSIISLFENYVKVKTETGQIALSTGDKYMYDSRTLVRFKNNLTYNDITPEFLHSFEQWFLKHRKSNGKMNSLASVGSIMRSLRSVLKYHIKKKIIPYSYEYPFLDYKIPNLVPPKMVISNQEIERIINCNEFKNEWEEYARNAWVTLYRLNGMNFIDFIKLRWENIRGDYLIYVRHKTQRTRRNNIRPIRIRITEKIQEMIDRIGDKDSPFIFGLINDPNYNETYLKNRNKKLKVKFNQYLHSLGRSLKLSMSLDISLARDAYANTLKRANVNPLKISENMNHSDPRTTTLHYLDNFDQDTLDEANQVVL